MGESMGGVGKDSFSFNLYSFNLTLKLNPLSILHTLAEILGKEDAVELCSD